MSRVPKGPRPDFDFALSRLRAGLQIIDSPFGSESTWGKYRRAWVEELRQIDSQKHLDDTGRTQFMRAIDILENIESDDQAVGSGIDELRRLTERLERYLLNLDGERGSPPATPV